MSQSPAGPFRELRNDTDVMYLRPAKTGFGYMRRLDLRASATIDRLIAAAAAIDKARTVTVTRIDGAPLTVYGAGEQTRCFCHVNDVVRGLITMLERIDLVKGQVVNLGNPEETSIDALARLVIAMTESPSGIAYVPFDEAYAAGFEEIMRRVPEISKARRLLDFTPQADLHAILADVIASVRVPA